MIQKIIKVLTEILENEFTGVEVYSTDIEAGYKSPCFFIMCNSVKTEKLSSKIDTLYINLDVLYACEDRKINQKECFEISEKLRNIWNQKHPEIFYEFINQNPKNKKSFIPKDLAKKH